MPTGYTYGILDGKIKNFNEFATLCTRGFGACMHLRDEPMGTPYTPREPSNYHREQLKNEENKLKEIKALSDAEILEKENQRIKEEKKRYLDNITKTEVNRVKLNSMLSDATKWKAPTKEHEGFKSFMIEQLTSTIKQDCNNDYYQKALLKLDSIKLDADLIRKETIQDCEKSIGYHEDELEKEITRCNEANKWMTDFNASL